MPAIWGFQTFGATKSTELEAVEADEPDLSFAQHKFQSLTLQRLSQGDEQDILTIDVIRN